MIPYRNCGAQNCSDSLLQVFAARQFLRQSSVSDELRQAPRSLLSDGYCVLTLVDKVFTRELWEMATECPVVFPDGVGVVPWMVPGGRDIAVATSELMKKYDVAIWAHHGMFAAGEDFDLTFGLMHTVEKSAEILVNTLSSNGRTKVNAITLVVCA